MRAEGPLLSGKPETAQGVLDRSLQLRQGFQIAIQADPQHPGCAPLGEGADAAQLQREGAVACRYPGQGVGYWPDPIGRHAAQELQGEVYAFGAYRTQSPDPLGLERLAESGEVVFDLRR